MYQIKVYFSTRICVLAVSQYRSVGQENGVALLMKP